MADFVYSVDRTDNWRLRYHRGGGLPESMQTKWHKANPRDEGLALCSRRIVLNIEDRTPVTSPAVGDLCLRCFPLGDPRTIEEG